MLRKVRETRAGLGLALRPLHLSPLPCLEPTRADEGRQQPPGASTGSPDDETFTVHYPSPQILGYVPPTVEGLLPACGVNRAWRRAGTW